ncbi:MAG TPA: virulence RhuM family protein [Candidatus Kapabacteria bacterium]|nr:virulence RhuM family protein [Candidatus Kapabacteria bacterium]
MPEPPSFLGASGGEFLLYQTEDGRTRLDVRLDAETVWLSLNQLAELFQRHKSVISRHLKNTFDEGELQRDRVVAKFATTAADGKTYQVEFFNLDAILSVGYRVNSPRGTQFRVWATQRLRDYLVKGFALDDDRLKQRGGGQYFDELLGRIRDIRSSEKVFWRKVLDIYATSIDYDSSADASKQLFATIQNKMHWAAHGRTAAEMIAERADGAKPRMGLTNWAGNKPSKSEAIIAKNYLRPEELDALNRIVTAYLEFAELQALNRQPMYMRDWASKLDDFLRLSGREILDHAGTISHEDAKRKAELEFERFHQRELAEPSRAERDFEDAVKNLKKLPAPDSARERRRKNVPNTNS